MSSIQNYLQKYPFNPKPISNKFAIFINDEDKLITSAIGNNREIENTLKLKINNELHKLLCIKLLVHLNSFTLLNALTIRELKNCEKIYDNDIFMKEKKNMLGFQIGILNKNKKFAIKNFEEWKINSQDSSEKILEMNEEGDLYNDKKQTIGFYNHMDLETVSLGIEEENTYLKIQEENKKEYDEMSGLIDICNICGYWK
tara:strand:+ start:1952 stop:2551 length:600 start_codon:yes stop_codon:yes gene_type:complete